MCHLAAFPAESDVLDLEVVNGCVARMCSVLCDVAGALTKCAACPASPGH